MANIEQWALRVPANKEGEKFTKNLRKYLNRGRYKVDRKWTGPRPKGTSQYSTIKENATSARLYIEDKFPDKPNDYWYDDVLNRTVSKTTAREAIQECEAKPYKELAIEALRELERIKELLKCLV